MAYLKINKATNLRASHTQFQKMTNSCRVRILCQMYVSPTQHSTTHVYVVFFQRHFHRTHKKGLKRYVWCGVYVHRKVSPHLLLPLYCFDIFTEYRYTYFTAY